MAAGALLGLIAVGYLLAAWLADTGLTSRWSYVAAYLALLLCSAAVWGWSFANFGVYLAVLLAMLIPWRQSRVAIIAWGLVLLAVSVVSREWTPSYIALISVGLGLATGGLMESARVSGKLRRAEQRVSVLAVAAERERIGRDLHDILVNSLTAISLKSALAGRLVDHDPEAAKAQLSEIADVARQALADVRSTASGYWEVRVAAEVASARSVLLAAGIQARVPAAIPTLSDQVSEVFGYVVREAVTNVVRHSGAHTCTIAVAPDEVSVADDGTGHRGDHPPRTSSGLRGLAERVADRGGRLHVEARPGGGTVVRVELPAPATDPSRTAAGVLR